MNEELIEVVNHDMGLTIPANSNDDELQRLLSASINDLIRFDFSRLINLLYRLDISETRLRNMLEQNTDSDAGVIIADLVIERQLQKIKTRKEFRQKENDIEENDKW